MQHELDAANAHISAEYFVPKDATGHKGVTAIAVRYRDTKFLVGHVVEQKGAGQQGVVSQLLKDLRKMGHHDKIVIRTDQEVSIIDFSNRLAKDRATSKTLLDTAPRSHSTANVDSDIAAQSIHHTCRHYVVAVQDRSQEQYD